MNAMKLRFTILAAVILQVIAFSACSLQKSDPIAAKSAPKSPAKSRIQHAVDFIRAEKFNDAFLAADPEEVRLAFLSEIKLAETNKSPQLRQMYQGYLDHAPLPRKCWGGELQEWNSILSGLRTLESVSDASVSKLDSNSEAGTLFEKILTIAARRADPRQQREGDMSEVRRLARELLQKYPDSLYSPMAAPAAARLGGWHTESVEPYLEYVRRANTRSRLALLRLAADERRGLKNPDDRQQTIAMYREIQTNSRVECERAHAQYEIARLTFEFKTPERIAEGKRLLKEYWQKYPKSADASWARYYFVRDSIDQGDLGASLALIEQFHQEDPDWSMAATAYVALSGKHRANGDYTKELEILHRATDNYPGTSAASLAWAKIGNRYPNLPIDREQIVALEKAVIPVTAPVDQPAMDRGEVRQAAKLLLEKVYLQQEEWRKCVELCLAPRYDHLGGCGDYIRSRYEPECEMVDTCLQHLPEGDPLRGQGIAFLMNHARRRYSSLVQARNPKGD